MAEKGIVIYKESQLNYYTSLNCKGMGIILNFIPFEHPYEELYLGGINFLNLGEFSYAIHNLTEGLVQNNFYPLGQFPEKQRPLLLHRGLARRIDF